MAVGSDGGTAAVWASVDGVTWSRDPDTGAVFGGERAQAMLSVAAGGPGLVAVGSDGSDTAVWIATTED